MERGDCKVVSRRSSKWGSPDAQRGMVGRVGDDELRTVECLKGRLQAEREASKAAKEEVDLLMKRLTELERLLANEMKHRDRAEKKLKSALIMLKSLNLVDYSGTSSSSDDLLSGMASICSEGKESSPNHVNSMVSEEGSWSTVGSAQSVNMGSKHFSELSNESKRNSCCWEFSASHKSCKEGDDSCHHMEHGSGEALAVVPVVLMRPCSQNSGLKHNSKLKF